MANCISIEDYLDTLREIAQKVEIDQLGDPDTRVNVWDISDADVNNMLENYQVPQSVSSQSDRLTRKLESALDGISPSHKQKIKTLIDRLKSKSSLGENSDKSARSQMVALKEIISSVAGEVNKASNMRVELTVISPGSIPNIPMARLAAMIGRKVLYQNGYRSTGMGEENSAAKAEHMYYLVGERILESLQDGGFVKINEANSGQSTLVDYLDGDKQKMPRGLKAVTTGMKSVTLIPKSLDLSTKEGSTDLDVILGKTDKQSENVFGSYLKMIDAVSYVTVPEKITFPGGKRTKENSYKPSEELLKSVKEIESKPLYMNSDVHSLFGNIEKEIQNTGKSASSWIKNNSDALSLSKLFNMEKRNDIESDNASNMGRNLSKSTPIDDVVEYFSKFRDNAALFFKMFLGRNARAYMENSVLNPQTSKSMRFAMEVEPYAMEVGSDVYKYYVDKVARSALPKNKDGTVPAQTLLQEDMSSEPMGAEIQKALNAYEKYREARSANSQLIALRAMSSSGLKFENFSDLLSSVKAIKGIRESLDSKRITSTYMVSSDATGSGGLLTLLQALGSTNETDITEILKSLGVFKSNGEQNLAEVKDIYGILTNALQPFLDEKPDSDGVYELSLDPKLNEATVRSILTSVKEYLFDGDFRELSKSPTMTFIYDQSEDGAIESMAETFTEKLLGKLRNNSAVSPELMKLLNDLLPTKVTTQKDVNDLKKNNKKLKALLEQGFIDSGVGNFLYDALGTTVRTKYLDNHKSFAKRVFKLISKNVGDPQFKVMPAAWVVERAESGRSIEPTLAELREYGVPLTKIYDVAREVDGGDVVLTREDRLAETVMNTSMIHTADTAAMFGSLNGLPTKHNTGVITVHDAYFSNAHLVMENDSKYIAETLKVAQHFDIQEQVLLAIKAFSGKKTDEDKSFDGILEFTRKRKATKQQALKDNFDAETNSVIGDGTGYRNLEVSGVKAKEATPRTTEQKIQGTQSTDSSSQKSKDSKNSKPKSSVDKTDTVIRRVLEKLSVRSPIIAGFLKSTNKATVDRGTVNSFQSNTDTITISGLFDNISVIEHEIVHSFTAGIIQKTFEADKNSDFAEQIELITGKGSFNQSVRDMKYIQKALAKIDTSKLSGEVKNRMLYAKNQANEKTALGEFVSIMSTEPSVAKEVYKQFGSGNTLKGIIGRVVKSIQRILRSPTAVDLSMDTVDAEILYSSINGLIEGGKSMRENSYEQNLQLQKEFGEDLYSGSRAGDYVKKSRDYFELLNSSMARSINDPAVRKIGSWTASLDGIVRDKFPVYSQAADYMKGIYDGSEALKSLVHKITNSNINNEIKNLVLSTFSRLRAERNDLISRELRKFKKLTFNMTEGQLRSYRDFTQKMAIQDYFILAEGVTDIDARVDELKAALEDSAEKLDTIVKMNVDGEITSGTYYNVRQIMGSEGDNQRNARAYVVLRSIQELGQDRFNEFLGNTELVTLIKDTVLANESLTFEGGIDTSRMRDNKLAENFETPIVKKAVLPKDMRFMGKYEKDGWKRLKTPGDENQPVILYKSEIDQTFQEGVFTDIRTQTADIPVTEDFKSFNNVVKIADGSYVMVLSESQRHALGASKDPSQSLVRTMAHNMTMKESAIIRNKLLEKETYWDLKSKDTDSLKRLVKDPSRDNPWFLGSTDDFDMSKHPELMKQYTPVTKSLSDHNRFDEKIQYVRKDIGYWLIGASEQSVVRDPKLQWALRITKNIVSGLKIGLIALNPVKILNDNISNITYLGVRGVDPIFLQRQYRKISTEFNEYHAIRNRYMDLKVRSYSNPGDYKAQMDKVQKELKDHPANGFIERGFLNSLGSELIMNTDDPSSGFKSDLDTILKKVFQDNEGKNNAVGRLIIKSAKWNVGLEELLETISPVFGQVGSTKEVEKSINEIADRWKDIKTQEDAVAYMHQYLNSPDSEFVKLGSHMTDLSDVLAKETLYRHLTGNGMNAKKAELEVIDSFPDYKESMPVKVRQLSDVGILMFPSYWLRIQKIIYRMVKDRPVSFGIEEAVNELVGLEGSSIESSNIVSKFNSHLGIFHNPWADPGIGNIVPTHVF
jgi:DNA-binding phage protein